MEKKKKNHEALRTSDKDHPERYETEKPSLFDLYESERNVDPIPVEEKNQEVKDERNKHKTKDTSSSERDYRE
ncbi:MAG: hypothetical protein ACI35R_11800 [Bacillus sp. (in: firmicutes)]